MAPTKKPRKPSDSNSDEWTTEESDSESYQGQKEIQATFEGRNPEGHDFHGIKQLLQQLFLKAHIDTSEICDIIINQAGVGSVLKQSPNGSDDEDDDDDDEMGDDSVFGITSVINLATNKNKTCVNQFFSLLDSLSGQHADQNTHSSIKNILTKHKKVGFLINERFINIPAKISVVILNSLYEEIERMKKKDDSYDFEYYIMICKTCKVKASPDEEIYSNDEEEIFVKESDVCFSFDVSSESDTSLSGKWLADDSQLIPHRKVLIFKANKLRNIINQVTIFVES